MTNEDRLVVNPLVAWLKRQKTKWKIYKVPGKSVTGWDIEARRHTMDLLIEAKYIDGNFLSSLNGLVTAPLANRPQHLTKKIYRRRNYYFCWAIGTNFTNHGRNLYQILFDYFSRNPRFWQHYASDLRLQYIFFIEHGKVARVQADVFFRLSQKYDKQARGKALKVRRLVANKLTENRFRFS